MPKKESTFGRFSLPQRRLWRDVDMPWHSMKLRVYYEDTDAGGVVYHAKYLGYAERGRAEMLRLFGCNFGELTAKGNIFVVRRCLIDYHYPARIDEELEVVSRVVAIRGAGLLVAHEVRRSGNLLVDMEVYLAVIGSDGRLKRVPSFLIEAIIKAFAQKTENVAHSSLSFLSIDKSYSS